MSVLPVVAGLTHLSVSAVSPISLSLAHLSVSAVSPISEDPRSKLWFPAFHFRPHKNFHGDPNGLFYDPSTKLYHMFCQYNPEGVGWGPMNWYHAASKDGVRWTHLPIALSPTDNYDCGGIFSGSGGIYNGVPTLSYSVECDEVIGVAVPENMTDPLLTKVGVVLFGAPDVSFHQHGYVLTSGSAPVTIRSPTRTNPAPQVLAIATQRMLGKEVMDYYLLL